MKSFIVGFILICASTMFLYAQDSASVANDVTIFYKKELSGGLTIHGSGFGALFRRGTHLTARKKRMFEAEMVSMRHPKQFKVQNESVAADTKPFFFGKLNYILVPRVGFGKQTTIFGKAEQSGVEVRYNFFGGLTCALAIPVYNDVLVPTTDNYAIVVTKRYDPEDPNQGNPSDFYGPASYFQGFGEMKFYPGLYGKFSFSFEHAMSHNKLAIIEAGMVADIFLERVPIMAYNENSQYFFNFYISLLWGGKMN